MEINYINDYIIDREMCFCLEHPFEKTIINNQHYHKLYYTLKDTRIRKDKETYYDFIIAITMDKYYLDSCATRTNASVLLAFKSGIWKVHFNPVFSEDSE